MGTFKTEGRNRAFVQEELARQEREAESFENKVDFLFFSTPGKYMVRILPEEENSNQWLFQINKHYVNYGDNQVYNGICPAAMFDEVCPICEVGQKLYASGDEASIEAARDLRPSTKYLYNVLVLSAPPNKQGEPYANNKVYVMEGGKRMKEDIVAIDSDEGAGFADITNPVEGLAISITRTGSGKHGTSYSVLPTAKRTSVFEYLQQLGVDFNSLNLYKLDEVYNKPPHDKLVEIASKIKLPGGQRVKPQFDTAPAFVQSEQPVAPPVVPQATDTATGDAPAITTTVPLPPVPPTTAKG